MACADRDNVKDIYGERTPYKYHWPSRRDYNVIAQPDKWVQSACVLCSNGCGLDIGVKDGTVVGVRGRVDGRVNKGRLGPKGLNGWVSINHPDRLTDPLVRKNGELLPVSWDEAMSVIVDRAQDIRRRLTNHGIAFYTSGQLFLEEYYVLALIGKAGLNTLHMDRNTRLCTATAAASMRESFGADGQPGSYSDVDYTDCIFMVGHNASATQTVLWARIMDRLEARNAPKLIVVDPRRTQTAKKATVHLAPKVGTNVALLNGIQHQLFKNGWVNHDWVSKHAIGVAELKEKVNPYTPQYVEEITEVPAEKLQQAAEIIGNTSSLLSTALQGVYQSNQATAAACQINNINLLLGHIGRPGSGILQMNGQPTAQNNREAGCNGEFPGFRNHMNPVHMQELADSWNINYASVPHWAQPTHIENMLSYMKDGSIEMMWISGTNPLVSLPNLPRSRQILTGPKTFIVCQDIFMTETAAIADVVLPAAQWGEKTGCFTNADRTVHLSHKAVYPPGQAKSDLDIFLDFSRRMDFRGKDGRPMAPWTAPNEVFEAFKELSRSRPCDYSSMSYEKLTGGSGIPWPCTAEFPFGKERLFQDGVFYTHIDYCESFGHDLETGAPLSKDQYSSLNPAGKAILKSVDYIPALEVPDKEYPFHLDTGRKVLHFHTRTKTGRSKALQDADPEPEIQVSETDAANLQVKHGDPVIVRSRRGAVQIPVTVGDIAPGHAFIPFHFGYFDVTDNRAKAANELTIESWDPISKQPTFKGGAVKIEKLPDDSGEVKIHAKENQGAAMQQARSGKPNASQRYTSGDEPKHTRRLELLLASLHQGINHLVEICEKIASVLTSDKELHSGLSIMTRLAKSIVARMEPFVQKYRTDESLESSISTSLRNSLFTGPEPTEESHGVLFVLHRFYTYLCHINGQLVMLYPASQALWDEPFNSAVVFARHQIERMEAWTAQQMKTKSPQRLLVPAYYVH